ncbi:MAG TPA: sigma-70 family RNA polymerase sigma factor [Bryobacteraceae bacterium]|jgi:RNA polymerase sigma factor (TIGR02999 family)|nr:sigma-70 family RNA polymerase sigma factor [Bryobacteraceae bacterium]
MSASPGEVTRLLIAMQDGQRDAEPRLLTLVYDELRKLAASYLRRERPDHTLQATALVHEAYLRLADQHATWQNRAHFFGVAAQVMRRILVDHARACHAGKRGSGQAKISLDEALVLSHAESQELLDLDEALSRLAEFDGRLARVVELRFFAGLSVQETAEVVGCATRTVNRDWRTAQAWLRRELGAGDTA